MRKGTGERAAITARNPAALLLSNLTRGYLFQTVTVTRNGWSCQVTALLLVKGAAAGSDSNPKTPRPWKIRILSRTGENMGQRDFLFRFIIANTSQTAKVSFLPARAASMSPGPTPKRGNGYPGPDPVPSLVSIHICVLGAEGNTAQLSLVFAQQGVQAPSGKQEQDLPGSPFSPADPGMPSLPGSPFWPAGPVGPGVPGRPWGEKTQSLTDLPCTIAPGTWPLSDIVKNCSLHAHP